MTDTSAPKADGNAMLRMVADVVAAYVGANATQAAQLPEIIRSVHESFAGLGQAPVAPAAPELKPAVSIKKSVTPDYIICLEDGKKLKMLKRHLRTSFGMSPDDYRAKWGLGADYPMVAPNYAERRSEFAKKIGLGKLATGRRKKR
ncbi:MAG: transcriptional regulator [Alphaproteobacteria bacterium]|nr:transcriptional regulator [Alphaproteobacteria bacterium]